MGVHICNFSSQSLRQENGKLEVSLSFKGRLSQKPNQNKNKLEFVLEDQIISDFIIIYNY